MTALTQSKDGDWLFPNGCAGVCLDVIDDGASFVVDTGRIELPTRAAAEALRDAIANTINAFEIPTEVAAPADQQPPPIVADAPAVVVPDEQPVVADPSNS